MERNQTILCSLIVSGNQFFPRCNIETTKQTLSWHSRLWLEPCWETDVNCICPVFSTQCPSRGHWGCEQQVMWLLKMSSCYKCGAEWGTMSHPCILELTHLYCHMTLQIKGTHPFHMNVCLGPGVALKQHYLLPWNTERKYHYNRCIKFIFIVAWY